jgi:hypothetical protein
LFYPVFLSVTISFQNSILPENILDALNVPPLNAKDQVDFVNAYVAAGYQLPREKLRPLIGGLLSAKLRHHVDAWLKTGILKDGTEVPVQRRLQGYPYFAVQDYLEKYPPQIGVDERGLHVSLGEPFGLPSSPEQLFERIVSFLQACMKPSKVCC